MQYVLFKHLHVEWLKISWFLVIFCFINVCVQFLTRNAMLSAVYAVVVCLSVCVCVSVTLRYCIKTAKRKITQITPHDSAGTLVF